MFKNNGSVAFVSLLSVMGVVAAMTAGASAAQAARGLVIHSAEFGVGKFHRKDNQVHPYDASNAWAPYILPNDAKIDQPLITDNKDGSVTIYFSTLDDLLSSVVKVSKAKSQPVSVLNVHGHGLPGGMWFPKDEKTLNSIVCLDWRQAANGSDQANYSQYYSAVTSTEIQEIRALSNESAGGHMDCITGLTEWKRAVAKNEEFKSVLSDSLQMHFLSCVVGLGKAGEEFTSGLADLLIKPKSAGRVETSVNFGLGDWSMPEGMGFWDYVNDEQINHDNEVYVTNHRDSEIAQKGTVRMVNNSERGLVSTLLTDRSYMALGFESQVRGTAIPEALFELQNLKDAPTATPARPVRVRIPGTGTYVNVRY
jgi:hypothetical protein